MTKNPSFKFEEAYCNYRVGKFISALNVLKKLNRLDSKSKLLQGQILYRLERFEEAASIFEDLIKTEEFPIHELEINLLAARSQILGQEQFLKGDSFDFVYNSALVKLASNDFEGAEQLANECYDKFALDENVCKSDLINVQLLAICAAMNDKNDWPESEFLLRKLKTSNSLTPTQETLINANLMVISEKMNINLDFNDKIIKNLNLFKSQKLQILANAHRFGFEIEKSQLKLISSSNNITADPLSKCSSIYDFKSLKFDTKSSVKKMSKKESTGLDKERWMPLRDRSYFKPKDQYLKAQKTSKVKVNKK